MPPTAATTPADVGLASVVLRPVRGASAFEATVEQLATAIRLGAFVEGDRLPPERELAAALGVSRATLREAIAALRQSGLVRTRSGRGGGTEVVRVPVDDGGQRLAAARAAIAADVSRFRDCLVVRSVVEPGAAATAAGHRLDSGQADRLRGALAAVSAASGTEAYRQADSRFHLAVATLSGSPRLVDLVTEVQRDLHTMLTAIPVLGVNISHSDDEHARIAESVIAGDAAAASAVMRAHCDNTASLLRGLLGMESPIPDPMETAHGR